MVKIRESHPHCLFCFCHSIPESYDIIEFISESYDIIEFISESYDIIELISVKLFTDGRYWRKQYVCNIAPTFKELAFCSGKTKV